MNYLLSNSFSPITLVHSLWVVVLSFSLFILIYFIIYDRQSYVICFSLFSVLSVLFYLDLYITSSVVLLYYLASLPFLYNFIRRIFPEEHEGKNYLLYIWIILLLLAVAAILQVFWFADLAVGLGVVLLLYIFAKTGQSFLQKREGAFFIFTGMALFVVTSLNSLLIVASDHSQIVSESVFLTAFIPAEWYIFSLFVFHILYQYYSLQSKNTALEKATFTAERLAILDHCREQFLLNASQEAEIIINRIKKHTQHPEDLSERNKLIGECRRLEDYITNMFLYLYAKEKNTFNTMLGSEKNGYHSQNEQQISAISDPDTVRSKELAEVSELKQMREDMLVIEKSRRDMYTSISHDLRTPLTSIHGYLEAILDGMVEDPQMQKEYLERIKVRIDGLIKLVEELSLIVTLESKEAGMSFSETTLSAFMDQIYARFIPEVQLAGLTMHKRITEELTRKDIVLTIDYHKMERVFGNIISNAIRYTPAGGMITLDAALKDKNIILMISDNGIGISKDDLPFLFERFYMGSKNRASITGNSGLGLAIAKEIVESHRGTIWAESERDTGTTFYISLPSLNEPA